ncbi:MULTISPECIES: JmjC domain-containing protein [unclassified Streptomyces]|uniref:JmjC domain-containing protein n=1 Tax=unclassified Streptomyces TaxID=2593676 RepID=UPI002E22F91C|nr:cupin domain-containing protein [Streptomyces sp. NBC_01023]
MDVLHRFTDDTGTFHAALAQRKPAVFRPADPPTELFPLDELDHWLDTGLLRVPYLQLVTEHGEIELPRFCPPRAVLNRVEHGYVDGAAVQELRTEATLLLRYMDHWHPGIRAFCASMREQLGRQVEAFCFVTPPGTQGRPVHRDDADVLVVQISGAKDWHLYGGPDSDRWAPGSAAVAGEPGFTTRLDPGEVLYVPRGHAHRAVAAGGSASAHLSFTVREAGGTQLHAALADLLTGRSGPLRPVGETELLAAADRMLADARSALSELTAEELVGRARARMRAVAPSPRHG